MRQTWLVPNYFKIKFLISNQNFHSLKLLFGVLLTQNQLLGGTKRDSIEDDAVDPVLVACTDIMTRLPDVFNVGHVEKKFPVLYTNSMNTVLRQEIIRYNRLLEFITTSLIDVKRAVQGQIAMVPQLENVYLAMSIGKLPDSWLNKSYPSLKPLGSYINDLLTR